MTAPEDRARDGSRRDAARQSGKNGGEPTPPRLNASTPATGPEQDPPSRPVPDAPQSVDVLHDRDGGCWQVITAASLYVLDLDRRTALRVPGAGAFAEGQLVEISALENDNELLHLDELRFCLRGYSMMLLTDPRPDGTSYVRISTPVIEIRRVPGTDRATVSNRGGGGAP